MLSNHYQIDVHDKVIVATITDSQISHTQIQELFVELSERMRYDSATLFVLDLGAVEFLASACLGSMVTFLQDLEHVRGRIALANCQPTVAFLFTVTRLDVVFPMHDDVDDACNDLRGAAA